MKARVIFSIAALLNLPLLAADTSAQEEVMSAAKKLAESPNYSWRTTVVIPEGAQFRPGPTEGKTQKDGVTYVTMTTFGDNVVHIVRQGEKGAATNREGDWESLEQMENSEGFGRFRAAMVRNLQTPASQALELVSDARELRKEGDAWVSDLTPEGAAELLRFRGRRAGDDAPGPRNAKGSVKFWIKDGVLSKYEFRAQGTVTGFDGNDLDVDRTTTVEIKDVGTTKIEVPEAAKKKLG